MSEPVEVSVFPERPSNWLLMPLQAFILSLARRLRLESLDPFHHAFEVPALSEPKPPGKVHKVQKVHKAAAPSSLRAAGTLATAAKRVPKWASEQQERERERETTTLSERVLPPPRGAGVFAHGLRPEPLSRFAPLKLGALSELDGRRDSESKQTLLGYGV